MNGRNGAAALLVLRLLVGWLFLWHGLGKFLGPPFAGVGLPAFSAILSLHLHGMSDATIIGIASAAAAVEAIGGLMLLFGFKTGFAASILLLSQVANVAWIRFDYGPFGPMGWEDNLVLMGVLFAFILGGPGAAAVDRAVEPAHATPKA